MKKTYVNPAIEVLLVESTELMQASLGVYNTEITKEEMLGREVDMILDEE